MARIGVIRFLTIGLLVAGALGCGAIAAGLRYNGTSSFPVGFYVACSKHPAKGDLVLANIASLPGFEMARTRGYFNVAYSPSAHILKRLVGVAGDRVTIDSAGVEINGVRLKNSTPLPRDAAGRPLQAYFLKEYVLAAGEILLMSDYNPSSFDSRYFGPLQATAIESVVRSVLTF
jgi:conjugative transfer signal peptidase TraF